MNLTQDEMVLKYLEENGSINTWQCYSELFITRLSAKIYNLRHYENVEIDEEWVHTTNRYGKKVKFKNYILRKEN